MSNELVLELVDTSLKIYTKSPSGVCVYCDMAKKHFEINKWDYEEIKLNCADDGYVKMRDDLILRSNGHRTFPWIFVGDKFIGGYNEIKNYDGYVNSNKTLLKYYNNDNVVKNYTDDSGFDLYCPSNMIIPGNALSYKIDLGVKAELYNSIKNNVKVPLPYMLVPRSSTGTSSPLRLSNSIGIIDRTYRGSLIAVFDNRSPTPFLVTAGSRLVQLVPFDGDGVDKYKLGLVSSTARGTKCFGSSGI
jgi:dUTP pyrophosphatase